MHLFLLFIVFVYKDLVVNDNLDVVIEEEEEAKIMKCFIIINISILMKYVYFNINYQILTFSLLNLLRVRFHFFVSWILSFLMNITNWIISFYLEAERMGNFCIYSFLYFLKNIILKKD